MQGRSQKQRGVSMLVGAFLGAPCIYEIVCSCADVPLSASESSGCIRKSSVTQAPGASVSVWLGVFTQG